MKDIDLSDIKNDDMDKTASFTDLMTRSEKKERERRKNENYELKDSLNEKAKKIDNLKIHEDKLEKTLINQKKLNEENNKKLDLTQKLEINVALNIKEEKGKKGLSPITDMGIFILIALLYFIYSLIFTNYIDNEFFLLIDCGTILVMFILFGISILTTKRNNKFFEIINLIILILYLVFNILSTIGIIK